MTNLIGAFRDYVKPMSRKPWTCKFWQFKEIFLWYFCPRPENPESHWRWNQRVAVPTQKPIWIIMCTLVLAVQDPWEGSGDPSLGHDPGFGNPWFKKEDYFCSVLRLFFCNKFKFWYFTITWELETSRLLRHSDWYLVTDVPEKFHMCYSSKLMSFINQLAYVVQMEARIFYFELCSPLTKSSLSSVLLILNETERAGTWDILGRSRVYFNKL